MARIGFRNPALMLSRDLPLSTISTLNYCTSAKGVFDDTTAEQMHDAMTEYAKVCKEKTLALFFHGGLVPKSHGMSNAQQLVGPYSAPEEPNGKAGNAFPYFFVWESGLLETLEHNLPGIIAETIFQRIRDIVGAKAQSIVTGQIAAPLESLSLRAPTLMAPKSQGRPGISVSQSDIDEVQNAVETDPLINAEKQRIARSAKPVTQAFSEALTARPRQVRTSDATLLSPEIVSAIVAEEQHKAAVQPNARELLVNPVSIGTLALGAGHVLVRIIQRYAAGREHNFHNTVIEEIFRQFYVANIGWAIWNEMKQETAQAFQGDEKSNVGSAMIAELLALYESGDEGQKCRVTLLGHSTGAVYICKFLAAMHGALQNKAYADKIQFDIIFMAPAVRVDILAQTLARYGHLIRNFRSFQMSDPLESAEILVQMDGAPAAANALLAQIYTSSLLYFISGSLEDPDDDTPIDGMARYFSETGAFAAGKFPTIDAVAAFYDQHQNAVILSDTSSENPQPPLGRRCTSHHHGGFPNDDTPATATSPYIGGTLQSVCYLLRTADYS